MIDGKNFFNDRVGLDNREFRNCRFVNVTFVYNGGFVHFRDNVIDGPFRIVTDTKAVYGTATLLRGLGQLKEGLVFVGPNLDPVHGIDPPKHITASPVPTGSPSPPPVQP
jgi:hypothetical protein